MRFVVLMLLIGCTDAEKASFSALGNPSHIKCYSGGEVFYEGDSTGVIQTVSENDGWQFKDAKTGKLVRVSGACVIEN
jgi:hypothetical protein